MMKFLELVPNIVEGFELQEFSVVLLNFWGENKDLDVLDKFTLEVNKQGAVPIRWQQSRELFKTLFSEVPEEYLSFPETYSKIFKMADVVVDIFMYSPKPHKDFNIEKLPLYRAYLQKLVSNFLGDKEKFIQVRIPTEDNAQLEGLDFKTYEASMYKALSIDYKELKSETNRLIEKLSGKNKVDIYTEDNNILSFRIEDREWHKDDGYGDVPSGEVYIAPVEESVEGKILIPEVYMDGEKFANVLFEFKSGKITECSSENLIEFIRSAPGDSDIFAEFGIGLNKNVTELIGCTVFDEKCIGKAHIAVGMNDMFGGLNTSPLHLDFVFTPVKVEMDNEVIMDGGNLL